MLNVIMLCRILFPNMLNVVMLSVVMLSVVAPSKATSENYDVCHDERVRVMSEVASEKGYRKFQKIKKWHFK
jgi:hypothetical protein